MPHCPTDADDDEIGACDCRRIGVGTWCRRAEFHPPAGRRAAVATMLPVRRAAPAGARWRPSARPDQREALERRESSGSRPLPPCGEGRMGGGRTGHTAKLDPTRPSRKGGDEEKALERRRSWSGRLCHDSASAATAAVGCSPPTVMRRVRPMKADLAGW
jgi:hypothetical protein